MSKEIFSPATLPPPTGYSHVAKVNKGTLVYIAGQVSSDASGKLVGEGNFEAQVEQVYTNVKLALEAAGATMADIVKLMLDNVGASQSSRYTPITPKPENPLGR